MRVNNELTNEIGPFDPLGPVVKAELILYCLLLLSLFHA